ncbi:MAG: exodeoxyribonuclease VII large subunit [Nitrospirae bacterium]|nr:exodeoxyribonuclease VII large subunit [Candidatus Troglogloeales bacterium]
MNKIFTVSELTATVRSQMEETFPDIWVEGEVAGFKIPPSGHCYFTLKDKGAQIKTILFRSYGRVIRFIPKEGEFVLIRGHLTVYEVRGEYQLVVDYIEPKGVGALMAAFEALKERLRIEGLFDEKYKKPIPVFPSKIALLTSLTGAVLQDFLRILSERETPVTTFVYPVLVQGESSAGEIVKAIETINRSSQDAAIDLIVLARGGGSLLDLWSFNEESVARAIFQSKIPIMTAIGHETDTTIADFVSDFRAATPSVAAEKIARQIENQIERFHRLKETLEIRMEEKINRIQGRLTLAMRLLISPQNQLILQKQRAAYCARQLCFSAKALIASRIKIVAILGGQLNLLSPLNILARGYSIAQKISSGKIIRDPADVTLEEGISITLHRGKLFCTVKEQA